MKKCGTNNAGDMLRTLREYFGLSLNAFGREIGYSGKQVARYERELSPISDEVIEKIILAYRVNPGYFEGTVSLENAVLVPDYEKEKRKTAARITERRIECRITQKALAKLCGCSETQISQIEHCKVTVTTTMAMKIAAALEVGTDWILKGDSSRKNYPEDGKLREWLWEHEEIRKELWIRMKNS